MHYLRNISISAASLALGLATLGVLTQSAEAQRPRLDDCDLANPPSDICSQGQGATFAFQAVLQVLRTSEANVFPGGDTAGVRANGLGVPATAALFGDQFNYASRGSGSAVDGISDLGCFDNQAGFVPPGRTSEGVDPLIEISGQECSFFLSEAPIGSSVDDPDIQDYYVESGNPAVGALPDFLPDSAYELGLGRLVQLPVFGGLVTVSYNINAVNTPAEEQLTAEEYCTLFNSETVSGVPGFNGTTGVVRSDGSGTTFAFSSALEATCGPLGLWETQFGTTRGSGEDGLRESDSTEFDDGSDPDEFSSPSERGDVITVDGTPLCETTAAERAGAVASNGEAADNFVCWPDSVIGGDGNDGVSAAVLDANGRYGYVELAQATADGQDTAIVENGISGNFFEATGPNGATAFDSISPGISGTVETTADSNVTNDFCVVELPTAAPTDGYPFVSFVYAFFYGDYIPTFLPANDFVFPDPNPPVGGNPNPNSPTPSAQATRFGFNGAVLASRYETLVSTLGLGPVTFPAKAALSQANYVPLPPGLGAAVAQRGAACINAQG